MILLPAIDLMGGKCVRLTRGEKDKCTVYADQPEKMAVRWAGTGAKWLHVIDLDAALEQRCFANRPAVRAILGAVAMKVEVGGGIRTSEQIRDYLREGVSRVIVGTGVLESRVFAREIFSEFGERVAVSIDSANGRVAVKGWTDYTGLGTVEAALRMREDGAKVIIFTDIRRDGMLSEPNFDMMAEVSDAVDAEVICAGGVSLVEHVEKLESLGRKNLNGAIIGKALYEGTFDLDAAVKRFPQ